MILEKEQLDSWIGRTESRVAVITSTPMAALAATLDRNDPYPTQGTELPLLWHWMYFPSLARHCELGPDGHPARGSFLPPISLARRMWGGSRIRVERPLRVGDEAERLSRISAITTKRGRSGPLVLVTVTHEIAVGQAVALTEEQDLIYVDRPEPVTVEARDAPLAADFTSELRADPVLLFRYSALTFNAHRIHYDRQYATTVEGYPGLVVHGPLLGTLLLELFRRSVTPSQVREFSFRAVKPLFDDELVTLCGTVKSDRVVELWVRDSQGRLKTQASVKLA